jgi:hypothetical protein
VQRQADDIRGRADDLQDEGPCLALDSVTAGLAAPFPGREISLEILARQPLEPDPRLDEALAPRILACDQANSGEHPMRPPRQQAQAGGGLVHKLGLGQDAPADRDHGVGGEHQRVRAVLAQARHLGGGLGLLARQARGQAARRFALMGRLVDIGGDHLVGRDPDLIEELQASRRGGGQDQSGPRGCAHGPNHLKR